MERKHAVEAAAAELAASARGSVPTIRPVQAGPLIGMIAQLLLLAVLAGVVARSGAGLGPASWVVGLTCAALTNSALALGLSRYRSDGLAPADWVTLARATLAVGIAALIADSFERTVPVALLISLAAVALALDAVDGWVARRTRTEGLLGARFDAEADAFLILILSVYVARSAGVWVLAIGAARYVFLAAGWWLPWMNAQLPPRHWRKVVCATQGIVLTVAAGQVLPRAASQAALVGALVLLAESFGRDVLWLRSRRQPPNGPPPSGADPTLGQDGGPPGGPAHGRVRTGMAAALTILAFVFVWGALVSPDQLIRFTPSAFLRVPLEGLVFVAVAVVVPARARRVLVAVVGPLLALVLILKILDIGFFQAFDRPFDPYQDASYASTGIETLRASIGRASADFVIAGVVVFIVALLALMVLALRRVTRVAAGHRDWSLRAVGALGVVWLVCWAFGAHLLSHTPVASTAAAAVVVDDISAARADIKDPAVFAKEIRQDRFSSTPANQLLTGLRGKDVLLAVVESYGKVAVQGSSFSPQVDAVLDSGTRRLQAAGFSARSAYLTSPTFGGISWLAHSTLQSGVWVNSRRRYDQLMGTNRFTLSDAFNRAGWRTVDDVPSNDRTWPQGSSFYHFTKVYDRRDVGYRGPSFAYASMPDQYVLGALQRLEFAKRHRRPVFAEVDLVSSHTPWTRIPRIVPWSQLGDGSIFKNFPVEHTSNDALYGDMAWAWLGGSASSPVRSAYSQSIQYTLNSLISYVQNYGDPNLVLVVFGDHQPWSIVSGKGASHEVPISVIAHDPAVLNRISGWGWQDGLRPGPQAPVWKMSAFRDRFLGAFDSPAVTH
ncbi:MAG: CDP-alcohol phosphatidyltransferase family protein [Solirubrobacteraceae bacterium]